MQVVEFDKMNTEYTCEFYFKDYKQIRLSSADQAEMKETLKCTYDVLLTYEQQKEIDMQVSLTMTS